MDFPLIVVPDPSARARKHSPDRKQVTHAPWLEYPALRVHEGDALTVEDEPGAQLLLREMIMHFAQERDALESGEAHQDVGVVGAHAAVFSWVRVCRPQSLQVLPSAGLRRAQSHTLHWFPTQADVALRLLFDFDQETAVIA